jgi:hypothetical protein
MDVGKQKDLAHALECMQAAYGSLIERYRRMGRSSDVRRLEAEMKRAEHMVITAFWNMEPDDA